MSTYYQITDGYNSQHDRDEVWKTIKEVAEEIQATPKRIVDEVCRIEPDAKRGLIEQVAACYGKPVQDMTIKIADNDDCRAVMQIASGYGPYRYAKESCRRAVCRLIMEEMHRRKMEISVTVG